MSCLVHIFSKRERRCINCGLLQKYYRVGIPMPPIKETESGLVVVTSAPETNEAAKDRQWGPIEIKDMQTRKELSRVLAKICEYSGRQGGIKLPELEYNKVREFVVQQFGYQLLGDDWSYEVKC